MNEKAKQLLVKLGAYKSKKGKDWNGYEVFVPQYRGNPIIGLPVVILQKGDEARISTNQECFEYLDFANNKTLSDNKIVD